jgi:two-component system sensor histidine kinase/response regulator
MTEELRRRAEQQLKAKVEEASPGELQRLVHELQVHQIELEIQNQDLLEAQGALQQSETRYRLLSELTTDVIIWAGPEGEIVYASPSCRALFGHGPEAFVADPGLMESLIHPDDRRAYRDHVAKRMASQGNCPRLEYRIRHPDDGERWIEHYCEPLRHEDGRYLGLRSSHRDITQRKQVELALQASENRYRELFESSRDALMTLAPTEWRFTSANQATLELFGATEAGFKALVPWDLSPPRQPDGRPSAEKGLELIAAAMRDGSQFFEWECLRQDGRPFPADILLTRMETGDSPFLQASVRDISERKRQAEELDRYRDHLEQLVAERTAALEVAKDRAETAYRAKSAFLANMSHEIRTPLNAVLGMTYLLRRTGVDAKQANYLDKIESSGRHLLALLNDILDISKVEAGKLRLDETDFSLVNLVRELLDIEGTTAAEKGLSFRVDIAGAPRTLRGDPGRLRQALLNYLGNAVKFTDQGSIMLRCRSLEEGEKDCLLRFEVVDTGPGIREEDMCKLFQKFEQLDLSLSREHGGSGLGLAITRRFAELMGGEAGVESEFGQGSCFWFTARLRKGITPATVTTDASDDPAHLALQREFAGTRLLLAEDNESSQDVAADLLRGVGLLVDIADNGRQAVSMAGEGDYALILMDMRMPVLSGLEATRQIRLLPNGGQVPILAMTANAFIEDKEACLAAGMDDYIAKPVVPDQLYTMVLRWLSRKSAEVQ